MSSGFVTADEQQQAAAGELDIIPCGEDVGYLDGELICGSDALAEAAAEDNAKGAYLESGDTQDGNRKDKGEQDSPMAAALVFAGVASVADGPLPIGDAVAAGALAVAVTSELTQRQFLTYTLLMQQQVKST